MDVLALAAAASVVAAVLAFALAFGTASSARMRSRLEGVMSGTASVIDAPSSIDPLRRNRKQVGVLQYFISGEWLARMERELRLADSQLQPVDFITIRLAVTGFGFVVPYLLLGAPLGLVAGIAGAVVGYLLPRFWLNNRKQGRNKKLEEQLPDALTLIANSLKAGFGLMQALSMTADQMEPPLSLELRQTVHETNVGSSMEEAFLALSERTNSYDLDLVITAILVQRSAGGNLAEILETVTETMRERVRIRGEINTLTAQQRLTGIIIGLLPVGVGGFFAMVSPDYIGVLFTETLGHMMLGVAFVLEVVGIIIIRRILAIEV